MTYMLYTVCIFAEFTFHGFSGFTDFAFSNSRLQGIVLCISINVYIFTDKSFEGGC